MLYRTLLLLHSWDRWIVLIAGVAAFVLAMSRWMKKDGDHGTVNRASVIFVISTDIQLLLGVALYLITPWFPMFTKAPAETMGNSVARFWAIEHILGMIVAIVLIHIGRVKVKKAASTPTAYRAAAILFGIALILMLGSTPWPFLAAARPLFRLGF